MSKHTPTPWVNELSADGSIRQEETGRSICEFPYDWPEDKFNAAFIVRACNAHDELVAALESIAEGCSFPADDVQKAIRDRARTALAKASA